MKTRHWVLDVCDNSYKLNECCSFAKLNENCEYGSCELVYNQSKTFVMHVSNKGLYSYNRKQNEWLDVNVKIPAIDIGACVITGDQRYILNFGNQHIYVIDLMGKKCFESKIVAPCEQWYDVVIIKNNLRSELITFGFVRKCWNEYGIGLDIFPPQYIVRLIQLWVLHEDIHIMYDHGNKNYLYRYHRKMNVAHIINNLSREWNF